MTLLILAKVMERTVTPQICHFLKASIRIKLDQKIS